MSQKESTVCHHMWFIKNFKQRIIIESIIVGAFAGAVAILYRHTISVAGFFHSEMYDLLRTKGPATVAAWFAILVFTGYVLGIMARKEPMAGGSGIPQVKGILLGYLKTNWLSVLVYKFIGGVLALAAGLSVGREGPSIQLGAAVAQGLSRMMGRVRVEEKYLITCGASAGLAAAFNAPMAGVVFALEELHRNFSPLVLAPAMAASLTAAFISGKVFGHGPVFNLTLVRPFPLEHYLDLVFLGIVTGFMGTLFNLALKRTRDIYEGLSFIRREFRPVIPIVAAGFMGFYLPQVLGGGHELITSLVEVKGDYAPGILLLILIVKFLFTMASYGSGVPGGIFLPLLAIGAIVGRIYGSVILEIGGLDVDYVRNLTVLGMAGCFASIVRAPITGTILITEMTGSFSHLLSLGVVSFASYMVAEALKSPPVYEMLLEFLLTEECREGICLEKKEWEIVEIPVCSGSAADGVRVRDLKLPDHCLLVAIKRGNLEIIPKGFTRVYPGDYLVVLTYVDRAAEVNELLFKVTADLKVQDRSL